MSGDAERDTEQDHRDYFDRHGHWPDEKPSAAESKAVAPAWRCRNT